MGSPITLSGFNSIDFSMILNAVMAQERTPLTRLENQQKTLETQNAAYGTLASKLTSLETAVESLKAKDSLSVLTATSSDSGVGVSTTSGTVTGTYDVVVTELAKAQVTSSATTFGALTSTVGAGTLTLTSADGSPATVINTTASTTLQELADQINAVTGSPASASVVQASPGSYKLVLSGRDTGTTKAFTITENLGSLAFTDTDLDGISGDSAADNTQQAINAALTVNGLAVTSASNTVTDVITGVTLSLTKKDPALTVAVKVERDISKAKSAINKFISAYNDLQTFAKDQNTAAVAGRASIGRDPLLKGLREALRSATMAPYSGGTLTRLPEIGIGFDMTGKMVLDSEVFEDAMTTSPTNVQTLVSGAAGDGGAFGAFAGLVKGYTQSGGLVASIRERIDEQVSTIGKRLDSMESALAVRKASLQREYTAADLAMTQLKAQSASLSSVGGGYKLF